VLAQVAIGHVNPLRQCGRNSSGGCHTTVRFPFLNAASG
jgi:hypothetical protein